MAILVLGKCSANFGRQILGKALEFPGKRLQKSLPECCFTLDTDFDWLRQKNKPRMANFPIENIAYERCNVLSHCKNGISQLSRRFLTLFCKYRTNSLRLRSQNVDYMKRQFSGSGTLHAWDLVHLRETAPSLDL
jgi:hypothetical protein